MLRGSSEVMVAHYWGSARGRVRSGPPAVLMGQVRISGGGVCLVMVLVLTLSLRCEWCAP